jgi:hypothetical protein
VSAIAKGAAAGVATAAGTGMWISLDGWPAAAAVGVAIAAGVALLLWVLASDARTGRMLSLIAAVRIQRR